MAESPSLPPDLFDTTTMASLLSTVAIVAAAYAVSRRVLAPRTTPRALRFLFIWHLADALCHFVLEGSFLYHCFFSYLVLPRAAGAAHDAAAAAAASLFPTPYNFLGHEGRRIYGPQAGGDNPFAQLWMVYARADRRWAGADLVRSPRPCSSALAPRHREPRGKPRARLSRARLTRWAGRHQPRAAHRLLRRPAGLLHMLPHRPQEPQGEHLDDCAGHVRAVRRYAPNAPSSLPVTDDETPSQDS